MIRINKRICSMILVIAMSANLSGLTFAADESAAAQEHGAAKAMTVLRALGIIAPAEDQTTMSRADFVAAAMKMRGYDVAYAAANQLAFQDVLPDHAAAGAISHAIELGILEVESESFAPDADVDFAFAIRILAGVLGYKPLADAQGGTPEHYLTLPVTRKLCSGLGNSPDGVLSLSQASRMLYNALHTNVAVQTVYGNKAVYEPTAGVSLMNQYMRLYSSKGKVTSNRFVSLSAAGVSPKGKVAIDDVVYSEKKVSAAELIGHYVEFYYQMDEQEQEDRALVAIWKSKDADYLKIDARDIISYQNFSYEYQTDTQNVKSANVLPAADFILNGKAITAAQFSESLLWPTDGYVELIGGKSGNRYETVLITSSYNCVVQGISMNDGLCTFTDRHDGANHLAVDLSDRSKAVFVTDTGGNQKTLEDIAEKDVLTVSKSIDGEVIRIIISRKSVQGVSLAVSDETLTVDENTFTLSTQLAAYFGAGNLISPGSQTIVYFDVYGFVAALTVVEDVSRYGFLAQGTLSKSLSPALILKVFDEDGRFTENKITQAITIDANRYQPKDFALALQCFYKEGEFAPQIAKIICGSNNTIKKIDTAARGVNESSDSLTHISPAGAQLPQTTGEVGYRYRSNAKYFDGGLFVEDHTKVFAIPRGRFAQEEDYAIKPVKTFVNDQYYDVLCYKDHASDSLSSVVVCQYDPKYSNLAQDLNARGGAAKPFEAYSVLATGFVNRITQALNEQGETVPKLSLTDIAGKNDVEYLVRWEQMIDGIAPGDIIRYYAGINNKITFLEKAFDTAGRALQNGAYLYQHPTNELYDIRTHKLLSDRIISSSLSHNPDIFFSNWRMAYLDVISITDGIVKCAASDLTAGPPDESLINHFRTGMFTNVYEYVEGKNTLVRSGAAAIISYEANPEGYSKLLLVTQYGTNISAVIIFK